MSAFGVLLRVEHQNGWPKVILHFSSGVVVHVPNEVLKKLSLEYVIQEFKEGV